MVARITVSKSIRSALCYNEQKVAHGVAHCLFAHHFLKEAGSLSLTEKRARFERLIALNKRAVTNAVHISLNFAIEEKLKAEKLVQIATSYMEKIGFGRQPYLVYQHHDAAHPHLHIVTTNIQDDGKRISLHNIGRHQSEKARKELEITFGLQPAHAAAGKVLTAVAPLDVQRLVYGKVATKQGIEQVLQVVLPLYKYTTLAELNAVLKCYNVMADGAKKEGALFRQRGLLYRVLDEQGYPVGVPIRARSVSGNFTLDYLEGQFAKNGILRQPYLKAVKCRLDWILARPLKSLAAFERDLQKEKISLEIRKNEAGMVNGLTYVDHYTRCVFNGSDLGEPYGAHTILERCHSTPLVLHPVAMVKRTTAESRRSEVIIGEPGQRVNIHRLLKDVMAPAEEELPVPDAFRKKKRRKPSAG